MSHANHPNVARAETATLLRELEEVGGIEAPVQRYMAERMAAGVVTTSRQGRRDVSLIQRRAGGGSPRRGRHR
jgi:hypothetical protein